MKLKLPKACPICNNNGIRIVHIKGEFGRAACLCLNRKSVIAFFADDFRRTLKLFPLKIGEAAKPF